MISIPYLICSILSFVPAIVCHEACHGFAAYKLGDPTAKRAGRLSFNPLKHIDPLRHGHHAASAHGHEHAGVRLREAGAVQPSLLQGRARATSSWQSRQPAANLVLAVLGAVVYTLVMLVLPVSALAQNDVFYYFLTLFLPMFSLINLYLMFFNLLPIPPLDGSSIFAFFLPQKYLPQYYKVQLRDAGVPHRGAPRAVRAAFQSYRHLSGRDGRQRVRPAVLLWQVAGRLHVVQGSHRQLRGRSTFLLYLVSRQKVDIGAISITQIADQYLAEVSRMDNLDLDVASDFLLVASTLLEIKAESLLPRERDAVAEEFEELAPSEARDILVERLLAYKQYKNAASALHMRFVSEGRMHPRPFGPDACFLNLMPDYLKDVTMDGLALLAARAFARRDVFLLESEHIAAKPIPVEVHVRAIHQRIQNKKTLRFSELVDERTPVPVVVVTFLAVLELYKRAMVKIEQAELFGDIDIRYIEGSGELVLTGDDSLTSVEEG